MNARVGFLKLATFVAVAALAPATVQAQSNRGQLVQAVVKLNQAQLAFAKKLADDAQFAAQFDKAASSQNYDAMVKWLDWEATTKAANNGNIRGLGDWSAAQSTTAQPVIDYGYYRGASTMAKIAALRAHKSQTAHVDDLEDRIRGWGLASAVGGGLPDGRLAEAFRILHTA